MFEENNKDLQKLCKNPTNKDMLKETLKVFDGFKNKQNSV